MAAPPTHLQQQPQQLPRPHPSPHPHPHPAPPEAHQPLLDEELLRGLVCGMLSQDPDVLRTTVSRHYAPGAVLYHYLLAAHTAEDVYRVYRSYAANIPPHRMPHAAARRRRCCMQLPFTSWPLLGPLLPEAVVPTLVIIKTRPDPHTGRPLVYEQYDHVSLYAFVWSFGQPALALFERVFKPAVMYVMGAHAWALDALEEVGRFARLQLGGQQALQLLQPLLPASWGKSGSGRGCSSSYSGSGSGRTAAAAAVPPACGEPVLLPPAHPAAGQRQEEQGAGEGGRQGHGGVVGRVVAPAVAAVRAARELPGEIDHSATDFGLRGRQLDGTNTLPLASSSAQAAAVAAAAGDS
ncbi:hypothetical protein CHLRE_09g406900v5 [Chlamydomonas reinhardtii]|uniref:Uncharacterized protein n=1 Tax=Chlamydomonas reinhardtii TaxID=3055 RepID=A0A2K3DFD7_CHLRE|nr:uncharacterized protein CHLRE_09g406900v5 [Chlamydomonas reinhardtii]PNW79227.1 hypothetical protein CHLRE_09g406900v5 [Chlamydomonas reinhardtii]